MNQINQYPIEAALLTDGDYLDIDKDLGGGLYQSQKLLGKNIIYDSGWKKINVFNGSFGLAGLADVYRPSIRVINRTVYISGFYLLPMDNGAGGLDANGGFYPSQYRQAIHYTGADGFTVGVKADAISNNPIIPVALYPQESIIQAVDYNSLFRTVNPSGSIGRIRLNTYASIFILTSGKILINGIETQERNGTGAAYPSWAKTSHPREIVSIFDAGEKIMDYSAWKNSFSAGGVDQRVYTDTGDNYDFTHDSTNAGNLGGYSFRFNLSYGLDPSLTIEQIKAAFDSI